MQATFKYNNSWFCFASITNTLKVFISDKADKADKAEKADKADNMQNALFF